MTVLPMSRLSIARSRVAVPRLDWVLFGTAGLILTIGTLLVWSATSSNDILTHGDSTAYLHKHLVNIMIGLVLAAAVMATDHRWVRIVTPLVYVASVIEIEDRMLATLNVAGVALDGFTGRSGEPVAHDDETDEDRLARRKARWTPTVLVEASPSA